MQDESRFDLTGRKFGKLTALRCVEGSRSRGIWACRCDCGAEKQASYHSLTQGQALSCGCARTQGKDLTGQRFGRLVAMECTGERKNRCLVWRCVCDCGGEKLATSNELLKGAAKSCGCVREQARRAAYHHLEGQRFGRLVAIEPLDKRSGGAVVWRCVCDCGNESEHAAKALLSGRAQSCGCLKRENDALQQSLHYIDGTCVEFVENMGAVSRRNTTGYRGLKYSRGKWEARITFKKHTYYLGRYADKEEAIRVRKRAEQAVYGEFLDWYYQTFPDQKTKLQKQLEAENGDMRVEIAGSS